MPGSSLMNHNVTSKRLGLRTGRRDKVWICLSLAVKNLTDTFSILCTNLWDYLGGAWKHHVKHKDKEHLSDPLPKQK